MKRPSLMWCTYVEKEGANWRWSIETRFTGIRVCEGICKSLSMARKWQKLNMKFIKDLK